MFHIIPNQSAVSHSMHQPVDKSANNIRRNKTTSISDSNETMTPPVESQRALILEGASESFYIGAETPKNLILDALNSLSKEMLHVMKPVVSAHVTLLPPNKSKLLHPSRPISIPGECQIIFNEITVSEAGHVNLRGLKSESHTALTQALASSYKEAPTERDPHSIIGRLPSDFTQEMFKHPDRFGMVLDTSREQPLLSLTLDNALPMKIDVPSERPIEQRLLSMALGETVLYAKSPLRHSVEDDIKFAERKQQVSELQKRALEAFSRGEVVKCPAYSDPVQFNATALKLAIEGDAKVGRVPLTFTMKAPSISEGIKMWTSFRKDVATTLVGYGYNNSYVSLLGSGATGYSGNPKKPLKAWTPNSDIDCAVFSKKLATQLYNRDGWVNVAVSMKGKYSVFKNSSNEALGKIGFYDLPVGKALEKLSLAWTTTLYGQPGTQKPAIPGRPVEVIAPDEIDFKLNIGGNPFDGTAITFYSLDHIDKNAGSSDNRKVA